ncbi:MAG TPA: F0F1 ATP synthase subunit delta [Micromonosporaceae bacterium]|jgi:F-type H+-transporting ATPase subunit delta
MAALESRESYAAAADRLEAYAREAEPTALVAVGDEILTVGALLERQPRLRRALSDPARTGEDRANLLRGLLEGKASATATDLVASLVTGRWSSSNELLDATERLGVEALLASADRAGELADVEDELFRFGQVVDGDTRLAAIIGDPAEPPRRRADLVHALLEGKARPVTIRLAEISVQGYGGRGFAASLTRLVETAAERRDRQVAYVTVATPLTEEEERRLGSTLSELYGREVTIKLTVDPEVLGGVSVLIGSDLYDGTVLRRLIDTRHALVER